MADPIRVPLRVSEPLRIPLTLESNILPKIIEGISPDVLLEETADGVVMTVTDKTGTETALIPKGEPGARGEPGEPGQPGQPGQPGSDGVSPTISVTDITGGHRVTITDADGAHSFDVMDGSGGGVSDVQVNGKSVVTDGVANVPLAGTAAPGAVMISGYGLRIVNGVVRLACASSANIKSGKGEYPPIVVGTQHESVFYGLAKIAGADEKNSSLTAGTYSENAKSKISDMLNAPVAVSGTTPSITAMAGVRYICGECATLDITVPESGIIDVVFESGSTATVLTVTPPTGMTMRWANGFDPTALDANTVYEINIMDGCYGVVGVWT